MAHNIQISDKGQMYCTFCGFTEGFEEGCKPTIESKKMELENKKMEIENKKVGIEVENKKIDIEKEIENKKIDVEKEKLIYGNTYLNFGYRLFYFVYRSSLNFRCLCHSLYIYSRHLLWLRWFNYADFTSV